MKLFGPTTSDGWPSNRPRRTLFGSMPTADVKVMLSHAAGGEYPPRSWLHRHNEPSKGLFLLQSGLVRLTQLTPEGSKILFRLVAPGEVFGYSSLILGKVNVMSAQAILPSRVAVWDRKTVLQLLRTFPRAALNLFNIAAHDVAFSRVSTFRPITAHAGQHVQWALAELVRTIGVQSPRGVVALNISQRDLAEVAGTTIYAVGRELNSLKRQGLIEIGRGHIEVLQPSKLLKYLSGIICVVATLAPLVAKPHLLL